MAGQVVEDLRRYNSECAEYGPSGDSRNRIDLTPGHHQDTMDS